MLNCRVKLLSWYIFCLIRHQTGGPGHNISTGIKIKYQQRVQQETIIWAGLPSLESFNYILSVFNMSSCTCTAEPVSDCCLTFNQNKTPPVLCLLTVSKSSWVVFTSPNFWLINPLYGLFIYDRNHFVCSNQICIFKFCTFAKILCKWMLSEEIVLPVVFTMKE